MALNSTPSTSLTSLVVGGGLNSPAKLTEQAPPGSTIVQPGSVAFEVQSTTKAMLPPRMSTVQKNAIVNKVEGSVVYDTDIKSLSLYNGTAWETVEAGGVILKAITKTYTGRQAIKDLMNNPDPLFVALDIVSVVSAVLTVNGTFFSAYPDNLNLVIDTDGSPPINLNTLENANIFKDGGTTGDHTCNLPPAGAANGGATIPGTTVQINFTGTVLDFAGGDATTTLIIQVIYVNQNA